MYDGRVTVLFRHPDPPPDFASVAGERGVSTRPGRHPLLTANTSVALAGLPTATVWLDTASTMSADSVRCWTRSALAARRARFARLGAAAVEYERSTELNEGLATYVERRAAGRPITLAAADLPADQVRQRSYVVGAALADLLDRLRPGWRDTLERAPDSLHLRLDTSLADAVGEASRSSSEVCRPTVAERAAYSAVAAVDVRTLDERRTRERAGFMEQPGWRVVVQSGEQPLWPQRFDPLNVSLVAPTEVLHRRMLRLRNDAVWIEVLDRASLSEGRAGQHPLFAGVRRLTLGASVTPFTVLDSAGVMVIDGAGVRARFSAAQADTAAKTVHPFALSGPHGASQWRATRVRGHI